ncbi:MAG: UvrD-helicase domain-containing protein [bacterium]|nr:UvrD-helicase domain-containing protein [bacterium]
MGLTEKQRKAIESDNKKVLVSAGAGTGKTTVLVDKYLRFVLKNKFPVDRILSITFTEKAAQEMKERIFEKLLETGDFELIEKFNQSYIGTIHGFCSRILKEFALEAGIDPEFNVLIYPEIITEKIFDDVFNNAFTLDDKDIINLLFNNKLKNIKKSILDVYDKLRTAGLSPEDYLQSNSDTLNPTRSFTEFTEYISRFLQTWRGSSEAVKKYPKDFELISELSNDCKDILKKDLPEFEEISVLNEYISQITYQGKSDFKIDYQGLKRIFIQFKDEYYEYYSKTVYLPQYIKLLNLFSVSYEEEKARLSYLDFEDLQLKVLYLLRNKKNVLEILQNRFLGILVDELQDTNRLQMKIISYLITASTMEFYVGDIKQSIYGFRDADIGGFRKLHNDLAEVKGPKEPLHILDESFRTRAEIIEFINNLFTKIWEGAEELKYEKLEPAFKYGEKKSPSIEIIYTEDMSANDSRLTEAAILSERIKEIVDNRELTIFDKKTKTARDVHYGDFAILLRSFTDFNIYENALRSLEIPYFILSGWGYFLKEEITDFLNYSKLLLNPFNDFVLLQVLRSYFVNISIDGLFILGKLFRKQISNDRITPGFIYRGLRNHRIIEMFSKEDREKFMHFLECFDNIRNNLYSFKLHELVRFIIKETGYDLFILSEPRGFRAYANINKLIRLASEFEKESGNNLSNFLEHIEFLKVSEVRQGEAQISSEKSEVVKIMTIHQAKGLEFPIVIIADSGRGFKNDSPNIFDLDFDLGFLVRVKEDPEEEKYYETPLFKKFKEKRSLEEMQEQRRVFYVSATRVKEHLIISGGTDSKLKSETYLNWVLRYMQTDDFKSKYSSVLPKLNITKITEFRESRYKKLPVRWKDLVNSPQEKLQKYITEKSKSENIDTRIIENAERFSRGFPPELMKKKEAELTPTQLTDYENCPYRYYLKYVLHAEALKVSESEDAASEGLIVHEFFQKADLKRDYTKEEIESELINLGFSVDRAGKYSSRLEKALESDEWNKVRSAEKVWREIEITSKLNNTTIHSKIDLIYKNSGKYYVVDFKSNKITKEQVDSQSKKYLVQMFIYYNAIKEIFSEDDLAVEIYFVYPNKIKVIDSSILSDVEVRVKGIISEILQLKGENIENKIFDCEYDENSERCKYCEFKEILKGD